jgi:hypothetical protein
MHAPTHKKIELFLKSTIVIGVAVLAVLCILLVREYRQVRRLDYLAAHGSLFSALRAQGPVGASDVGSVATWMTFDYLNRLFALPPNYLQTSLALTDSRYPRLTIREYAEDQHMDQSSTLAQVQDALRAYFAQKQ